MKEFIFFLFLFLSLTGVQAQESLVSAGGDASGGGGSVSYSVGQVFYLCNAGTNASIIQGVQQPYKISAVTEISETDNISLALSVFPNPTTDYLTLKVVNHEISSLKYQLCDMNGKLLDSKELTNPETNIAMGKFQSSAYFLKVIQNNKEIKTFKIIKY